MITGLDASIQRKRSEQEQLALDAESAAARLNRAKQSICLPGFCSIQRLTKQTFQLDSKLKASYRDLSDLQRRYDMTTATYNSSYVGLARQGLWELDAEFVALPQIKQRREISPAADADHVVFRFRKATLPEGVSLQILSGDAVAETFEGGELLLTNGFSAALPRAASLSVELVDRRPGFKELVSLDELFRSYVELKAPTLEAMPSDPSLKSINESDLQEKSQNESVCYLTNDRRKPFKSSLIGQVFWVDVQGNVEVSGTAFRVDQDYVVSAGHVFPDFGVALSDPLDGFQIGFLPELITPPSSRPKPRPEHVFFLEVTSAACSECYLDNPGKTEPDQEQGNDWAVFRLLPNKTTKQTVSETFASDGHFSISATLTPPPTELFVAGFGKSKFGAINRKMQVGSGQLSRTLTKTDGFVVIHHNVDTTDGSSGGPVFVVPQLEKPDDLLTLADVAPVMQGAIALGVHGGSGCGSQGNDNEATSFGSTEFSAALKKRGLVK